MNFKINYKKICSSLILSSLMVVSLQVKSSDSFDEKVKQYNKSYETINIEKLKKYEEIFVKNKDWIALKTEEKSKIPEIIFWQTYNCELCTKAKEALNTFEYRKKMDANYKSVGDIFITTFPIVLDKSKNVSKLYFRHALLFNVLKNVVHNKEDFEKINLLILKATASNNLDVTNQKQLYDFLNKNNVSIESFEQKLNDFEAVNTVFYLKEIFEKQNLKDIPMIIFNNKYVIGSESIAKLSQNQLIDLIEYVSIIAILDSYNLITVK